MTTKKEKQPKKYKVIDRDGWTTVSALEKAADGKWHSACSQKQTYFVTLPDGQIVKKLETRAQMIRRLCNSIRVEY